MRGLLALTSFSTVWVSGFLRLDDGQGRGVVVENHQGAADLLAEGHEVRGPGVVRARRNVHLVEARAARAEAGEHLSADQQRARDRLPSERIPGPSVSGSLALAPGQSSGIARRAGKETATANTVITTVERQTTASLNGSWRMSSID